MDETPPSPAGRVNQCRPEVGLRPEPENPGERMSGKTGVMRTFPSFPFTALGAQLNTFVVRLRRAGGLSAPLRRKATRCSYPAADPGSGFSAVATHPSIVLRSCGLPAVARSGKIESEPAAPPG